MDKNLVKNNHFPSIERGFMNFTAKDPLPNIKVSDVGLNNALTRVYEDATAGEHKVAMDNVAEDMHNQFITILDSICFPYDSADSQIKSITQQKNRGGQNNVPISRRVTSLSALCDTAIQIAKGYEDIGYEMDGGVAEYYLTKIHLAKARLNFEIGKVGDIVVEGLNPDMLYLETLAAKSKDFKGFVGFDRDNDL